MIEFINRLINERKEVRKEKSTAEKTRIKNFFSKNNENKQLDSYNKTIQDMVSYPSYPAVMMPIITGTGGGFDDVGVIQYNSYIPEVETVTRYTNYISEQLNKTIAYSEYIAENVDAGISFKEYLIDKSFRDFEYRTYNGYVLNLNTVDIKINDIFLYQGVKHYVMDLYKNNLLNINSEVKISIVSDYDEKLTYNLNIFRELINNGVFTKL